MTAFHIREADLARDKPAFLTFIMGTQRFEYVFEPNRRLDAEVAADYLEPLLRRLAEKGGRIVVAENADGLTLGWGVVLEAEDDVFVVAAERRYAYIAELFVVEGARGMGVGRALIAACEDWARSKGNNVMQIGVLPGNARAKAIYEQAGYSAYGLQLRRKF